MKICFNLLGIDKGVFPVVLFFVILNPVFSQNLLNIPESIIFDESHNRYLISNYGTGDIVQVDSNGHQSYFVQGANAIQGLEIAGNVVYVGAGQMVRGFNLETGQMVMDVHIPNVSNLNDVTADTSGNIYASDVFGTKIIKIEIATDSFSVLVDGQGINQPNGIFYDKSFNRILVCSYRPNSPIQAINLADLSVSTLVNTNLSYCDGITKDRYGNYYVTSWSTLSFYRFDSLFHNPPELVYANSCGAADISYDNVHNVIAIPLQICNSWATMSVLIGIKNIQGKIPEHYFLYQNYPNPFNPSTTIKFSLPYSSRSGVQMVKLSIYDISGKEVTALINEQLNPGIYEAGWSAGSNASGVYFYKLETDEFISTKKMVLLK